MKGLSILEDMSYWKGANGRRMDEDLNDEVRQRKTGFSVFTLEDQDCCGRRRELPRDEQESCNSWSLT